MTINKLNLSKAISAPMLAVVILMSNVYVSAARADTRLGQRPSIVVKYGDLDLTTAAGARRLYTRIVGAAERVCPDSFTLELQFIAQVRACRAEAISRAVQDINNQQLALIHAQSSRHG